MGIKLSKTDIVNITLKKATNAVQKFNTKQNNKRIELQQVRVTKDFWRQYLKGRTITIQRNSWHASRGDVKHVDFFLDFSIPIDEVDDSIHDRIDKIISTKDVAWPDKESVLEVLADETGQDINVVDSVVTALLTNYRQD